MVELAIYLEVIPGREKDLEKTFLNVFVPAISVQKGFQRVEMLHSMENQAEYQINLTFQTEELRLKWVASKEHQTAFPQIDALCKQVSAEGFEITCAKE